MIGMIQILTYLLAVYLVFKGFEILQIALMSSRTDRTAGIIIGVLAVVFAFGVAGYFVDLADSQAKSVSTSFSR